MTTFLTTHGLAVLFLALALLAGARLLWRFWRRGSWSMPALVLGAGCLLVALGGLTVPPGVGVWLAAGAFTVLFFLFLWLVLTGQWSALAAVAVGAILLFGVGSWTTLSATEELIDLGRTLAGVQVVHPLWLFLLLLVPLIVLVSRRSLSGMGRVRRWVAIGLRSLLIVLLTLALAEVRFRQENETVTVLFLYDRSLSVPPELDPKAPPDDVRDLRFLRIKAFLKEAVEKRGDAHKRDKYGLILFGREPSLELPPSDAKKFRYTETPGAINPNYTDIAAALKLALASFPEGSGKRIVLLSDGNENLGNALEQARLAERNGVQIDVVPLAPNYKNESEVLVQSVEAPPLTEQGARFPIRVLVRSYNPNPIIAAVKLTQVVGAERKEMRPPPPPENLKPGEFVIRPGLNSIIFPPPPERPVGSFTYVARVEPKNVVVNGKLLPPPRGHLQNKEASTHVLAQGQRKVLLVEGKTPKPGEDWEHEFLYEHLKELQGKTAKFRIDRCGASKLAALEKDQLALFLTDYDCILLANVPSEALTEEQQEVIRSNTHDLGCGLVMIGGPDSYGAGGWQGTPVEKALPVDCDIKSLKVQGTGGLVLIFHASEADAQNSWQKAIGKLAMKKLAPDDMVGVLLFDGVGADGTNWHVPFQKVGDKRDKLMRLIDTMAPGDMPDCNPSFRKAHAALTKPEYKLNKKHIIFISDGDHWTADPDVLKMLRKSEITCTTVLVTTHGGDPAVVQNMSSVALATKGRYHYVTNPKALPKIYTEEARLVSQSFIYEKKFDPKLVEATGPADKLPEKLPPLYGFVRTTPKAPPLAVKAILGPSEADQDFPVLAYWQYGLGKSVAYTSSARRASDNRIWDKDWANSPMYKRFWEQVIEWSLRPTESGALTMTTEYRDGKVKVIVEARDKNKQNRPITDLRLEGTATSPSGKDSQKLKFEQKNSGQYEAEFKAEEAGSYFITAMPMRSKDGKAPEGFDVVRAGVTVPYSPEFADLESNAALLEELRRLTGGKSYADDAAALTAAAASGDLFRPGPPQGRSMQPFWHWLLFLAGIGLVFDVAVRRIAIDPQEVAAAATKLWDKLRGRVTPVTEGPQFLDRLRDRKEQVGETLERQRAETRFEGGAAPTAPPEGAGQTPAAASSAPPSAPPPGMAPEKEAEPDDFAARLLRAKRKAMEDRDKGKNP